MPRPRVFLDERGAGVDYYPQSFSSVLLGREFFLMAIRAVQAVEGHEPPGRQNALIPIRTKRGTLAVYAIFFIPLFIFSLAFPLAPLIAWASFRRVRYHRWTTMAKVLVTAWAFGSLFWFSLVFFAHASSVLPVVGTAGWVSGVLGNLPVVLLGSVCGGVAAGLSAAWWDWQRKPFYKQPDKAPTLVQAALMERDRRAIREGRFDTGDMVTFGLEDGPRSLGRVIQVPLDQLTHAVILGRTKTGKTQTGYRFAEAFISRNLPFIGLDMKGSKETTETLRAFAEYHGRPFYLFTLTGGGRWDALRDKPNASLQKDVLMSVGSWSDAHYKALADGALLDIFAALQVGGPGAGESMVAAAARLLDANQLKVYANKHLSAPEHSQLRTRVLARADQIALNPNAFSGVKGQLDAMVYSETGQFFAPGEGMFSLRQAFNENAVVLFSFDHMNYPETSKAISALVLADVKSLGAVLMNEGNKKDWCFWGDEFNRSRAADIAPMMQQIRESQCKIVLMTQSVASILDAGVAGYEGGGDAYRDIVLSQASLLVCHASEEQTAQYVQKESGEAFLIEAGSIETTRKDSILDADSGASGDRGFAKIQTGPAIKIAEIQSLPPGGAVMLGQFEVGYLAPEERPVRKARKGDPSPKLLVNFCRIERSQVAIDAADRVEADLVETVNEVDPAATPVMLEPRVVTPAPASGRVASAGGGVQVPGIGPAGSAAMVAGLGAVAGADSERSEHVEPFMFADRSTDSGSDPGSSSGADSGGSFDAGGGFF